MLATAPTMQVMSRAVQTTAKVALALLLQLQRVVVVHNQDCTQTMRYSLAVEFVLAIQIGQEWFWHNFCLVTDSSTVCVTVPVDVI